MRLGQVDIIALAILKDLESYRNKLNDKELSAGTPDHTIRMCEAMVAHYSQFKARADWVPMVSGEK